jgi:fatty acid desaturase
MRSFEDDSQTITGLFSADEWRELAQIRPWPLARAAVGTWACILGALYLWSTYPGVITFVVAAVVIGARQHALNNLVHEASHFSVSRNKTLNDWLSDVFFATPHFISTNAYRVKHTLHHSGLGDPHKDTEAKPRYVLRGVGFLRHTAMALCGLEALRAAAQYSPAGGGAGHPFRYYPLTVATNGALLAYCAWLGKPEAYFLLWLLPLFTVAMYISTLRVIAEHQSVPYAQRGIEDFRSRLPRFTRSIPAGAIERFFFGPVNFCYHQEHHLAPGIPFPNLPTLHHGLRAKGYFAIHEDRLGETYIGTLMNLVFPPASVRVGPEV